MINRRGWRYSESFRQMGVERCKCCENIELLAKQLGVPRQTLYRWFEESERMDVGEEPATEKSRESRLRRESSDLKRLVAEKTLEVDFSKAPCRKPRLDAARAAGLASRHLRPHPGRNVAARRFRYRADVPARRSASLGDMTIF
jgi:hypothetical protein